ncbi:hypothetical protein NC652_039934 [Populus alba x Populus x berolinensis]|uniref:Uncharacterized protein n=1 Tax=Populus alba x Populus x berolinensis TaxID=444605 RepID=A0AAD6LCE4_9ROSI|nr:hypothetical protein NC652_039901 [Populus alba x Populus x berolinensis]KAJ6863221.1 hypothetical protein NC652_039928 [Populus alba x Populus x berolinensis]KAJ6863230.1 hypothetical protein NC652_039934 [Populus alba x Populus x berolinensis]KAJ6958111.1 hypothetical protein NC653_039920 [Populus alba x Populus x berolinensis]
MRKSTPDMIEKYEVIAGHDLEGGLKGMGMMDFDHLATEKQGQRLAFENSEKSFGVEEMGAMGL